MEGEWKKPQCKRWQGLQSENKERSSLISVGLISGDETGYSISSVVCFCVTSGQS